MTTKTISVSLGRARLPKGLAAQLQALPPGLRGRTMAFIVLAHVNGLDVQKLIAAAGELRRLGVLVNQSLRVSGGRNVDAAALNQAVERINQLWP
ncbi:MAG TPA: hypothetical protein VN873_04115 [Candidatus Angelobacter sp.]|nr:hypothetical protein [Candidatus Angelobacter sp.]